MCVCVSSLCTRNSCLCEVRVFQVFCFTIMMINKILWRGDDGGDDDINRMQRDFLKKICQETNNYVSVRDFYFKKNRTESLV